MQDAQEGRGFRIDDIVVEPLEGALTHPDGRAIHLEPKVIAVLVSLARHSTRTVSRTELLETVWRGQVAADELLTRAISEIRRALGDDPRDPKYIRTVPKRGYCLIGEVKPLSDEARQPAPAARTSPLVTRVPVLLTIAAVLVGAAYLAINGVGADSPNVADPGDELTASTDIARPSAAGRPRPLTSSQGSEWAPALSPDGNYAAFVASPLGNFNKGDIHVVEVGSGMPVPLTNDVDAGNRAPTWSPDGRRIAFARFLERGRSEIVMKPMLGGFETRLATVEKFWGHDWSPEGDRLAVTLSDSYQDPARIHLLSINDGTLVEFTNASDDASDLQPRFSPDGQTLAFIRRGPSSSGADLCLQPLAETTANCITPASRKWPIKDFAWSPNGESLIVSADGLLRVPVSGGIVEPLPFGDNAYNIAIARNANRLVFERFIEDSNLWRIPGPAADAKDTPQRLIASTRAELLPRYSPDGSKIAFVSGRTGGWEVWIADAEGVGPRRLTEWGYAAYPAWSPDGELITFSSGRYAVGRGEQAADDVGSDPDEAFLVEASGGVPRMISDGESGAKAPSWSADGQYVFFTRGLNECGSEGLWRRQLESGEEAQLTDCAWRPLAGADGRVYFYNKSEGGISSVLASGGDERLELESKGHCGAQTNGWTIWASNLVYVDCEDLKIKMLDLETRQTSELSASFGQEHLFDHLSLDVSPDGQWILFSRLDRAASDLILIESFQ